MATLLTATASVSEAESPEAPDGLKRCESWNDWLRLDWLDGEEATKTGDATTTTTTAATGVEWYLCGSNTSVESLCLLGQQGEERLETGAAQGESWELWLAPAPMTRNVTALQLREASTLVRDGYGTADEVNRLGALVASVERSAVKKEGSKETQVADGLLALSEAYVKNKDVRLRARAAIDRGLYADDTAALWKASAERTGNLAEAVARAIEGDRIDGDRMARVLDGAGLSSDRSGADAAHSLRRLSDRVRKRELTRAETLQLKRIVHAVATLLLLPGDLSKLDRDPADDATYARRRDRGCLSSSSSGGEDNCSLASGGKGDRALSSSGEEEEQDETRRKSSRGRVLEDALESAAPSVAAAEQPTDAPTHRDFGDCLEALGERPTAEAAIRYYESRTARRRGAELEPCDRIWAVSDLHADVPANAGVLQALAERPRDAVIVAGDVASTLRDVESTLVTLRAKFKHVFYVPGNHEMWHQPTASTPSSVHKLFQILDLCDRLDVVTTPSYLPTAHGRVLVVPLFSWYRRRGQKSAGVLEFFDGFCSWPFPGIASSLDDRVADLFLGLNRAAVDFAKLDMTAPTVSFSHFVPHVDRLFPGFLAFRHVMGCPDLDRQIDALAPVVHVFGHSHINADELLPCSGTHHTRFVQNALGHPDDSSSHERANFQPLLVWG